MPATKPSRCLHCLQTQAYQHNPNTKTNTPVGYFYLCGWPDSVEGLKRLKDAPRWMQNNALSGHLMNDGDCNNCPQFQDRGNLPIQEISD